MRLLRLGWPVLLQIGLLGLGLGACSGGREPRSAETDAAAPQPADQVRPTATKPLLDLPAALGLRARGFVARFGPPRPAAAGFIDPGKALNDDRLLADSVVWFEPQGLPMLVSFRPGTGQLQDVLLLGPDETTLMRQALLLPNAPSYLLLPVFQPRNPNRLLGLRVVPK